MRLTSAKKYPHIVSINVQVWHALRLMYSTYRPGCCCAAAAAVNAAMPCAVLSCPVLSKKEGGGWLWAKTTLLRQALCLLTVFCLFVMSVLFVAPIYLWIYVSDPETGLIL